jgi:hypothetical protein
VFVAVRQWRAVSGDRAGYRIVVTGPGTGRDAAGGECKPRVFLIALGTPTTASPATKSAAADCLSQWRYRPFYKDGRALGPASSPSVIVSATLQELQDKTSHAVTAGGTLLPMSDVIRIATHAYHYLALFDGATGQALWLGRTKRLATGDQRIVLHAAASSSSDSPVDP